MSADPEMIAEFAKVFKDIDPDKPPRPELFGHNRLVRHVFQLEQVMTRVLNALPHSAKIPVPKGPVTAYERWEQQSEDKELNDLFGDILKVSPKSLGMIIE